MEKIPASSRMYIIAIICLGGAPATYSVSHLQRPGAQPEWAVSSITEHLMLRLYLAPLLRDSVLYESWFTEGMLMEYRGTQVRPAQAGGCRARNRSFNHRSVADGRRACKSRVEHLLGPALRAERNTILF
jgi:hypothetical protein